MVTAYACQHAAKTLHNLVGLAKYHLDMAQDPWVMSAMASEFTDQQDRTTRLVGRAPPLRTVRELIQ